MRAAKVTNDFVAQPAIFINPLPGKFYETGQKMYSKTEQLAGCNSRDQQMRGYFLVILLYLYNYRVNLILNSE